jgi:hypothetical protein
MDANKNDKENRPNNKRLTTMRVSKRNLTRLREIGISGETPDKLLKKLLDEKKKE